MNRGNTLKIVSSSLNRWTKYDLKRRIDFLEEQRRDLKKENELLKRRLEILRVGVKRSDLRTICLFLSLMQKT